MASEVTVLQVDAFADRAFGGNPAAVCLMNNEADDQWLQNVAMEMNLSETAFVWDSNGGFRLRWFTPKVEVELCGHATLAAAHALWETGRLEKTAAARFETLSGTLTAELQGDQIFMDFPAKLESPFEPPDGLVESIGVQPTYIGKNQFDVLIEVGTQREVQMAQVDFVRLADITVRGAILTAKSTSDDYDFVSRFFAPACGIDEDPVTGSAHVCLAPFWSRRLNKRELVGYQASERGGIVHTRVNGDRVQLGGTAITIMRGKLLV